MSTKMQDAEPSMHRLIRPKGGDCLVKQIKAVCSIQTQQNETRISILHSVVDTYLVDIEWVPVIELLNNTASAITLPATLKSQFVVAQNSQTLRLPNSVDGLCIESDGKPFKTFRAQETSSPETMELSFHVKPNNYIVNYQKRWRFKHKLWFIFKQEDGRDCAYTTIDRSSPGLNDAVDEVDITPVKEMFRKGTVEMNIVYIPILYREAIVKLLA